jgi:hypothetical protein
MEQNTNPTPQQPQGHQGFDFKNIPTQGKIMAIIGLVGLIAAFLPLYRINAGLFGSYSVSMINAWQGVFCFLAFAGMIVFSLFGKSFKMDEKLLSNFPKYLSYAACAFALLILLQLSSNSVPLGFLGIGYYLTILASIASILVSHEIIKVK